MAGAWWHSLRQGRSGRILSCHPRKHDCVSSSMKAGVGEPHETRLVLSNQESVVISVPPLSTLPRWKPYVITSMQDLGQFVAFLSCPICMKRQVIVLTSIGDVLHFYKFQYSRKIYMPFHIVIPLEACILLGRPTLAAPTDEEFEAFWISWQ